MRLCGTCATLFLAGLFLAGSGTAGADGSTEDWRLSTAGYGPARIGMSVAQAASALGARLTPLGPVDEPACYYVRPEPQIEGLAIMVSHGRVVRFDVDAAGIKSRSGLGVGDPQARVLDVLGASAVEITPHKYTAPDGQYLTVWTTDRQAALRFETYQGKVTSFHAGRIPEATYVEGCS